MTDEPRRILVVDDEPSLRDLVRIRLEREGFLVVVAEDGRAALNQIAEQLPNLIITDMMMPRLDGIGLIKRLREQPRTALIPILMLTARDRGPDRSLGLDAGADDYLGKPFDFPELISRVNALLRRAERATTATADAATPAVETRIVAFLGAKGGVGTTTIAINVATILAHSGFSTILAELQPMRGTIARSLNLSPRRRLDRLPLARPEIMTVHMVEDTLLTQPSGLRVLLGPDDLDPPAVEGVVALVEGLRRLAPIVVVDLASMNDRYARVTLDKANQIWVITEPEPTSLDRLEATVSALEGHGARPNQIGVIANQTAATMTLPMGDLVAAAGRPISFSIQNFPQACAEAIKRGVAVVELAPDLAPCKTLSAIAAAVVAEEPLASVSASAAPSVEGTAARAALRSAAERTHSS